MGLGTRYAAVEGLVLSSPTQCVLLSDYVTGTNDRIGKKYNAFHKTLINYRNKHS